MEPSVSQPAASKARSKPHLARRWPVRLLRIAAIVYLLYAVLVAVFQEHLIFPGAYMPIPAAFKRTPANSEPFRVKLPNGLEASGIFLPGARSPASAQRLPTILYFYGNGNTLSTSADELELFRNCGANVLSIDFPGYGPSAGKPSEANCYAAANALWDYALARPEVDPNQIIIVGWSLGGAVAIDLAQQHPTVRGLFTISTFTTMGEMAHISMPLLPTQLLLRHQFRSIGKLPDIHCPIIIAHGEDDPMIPYSMSLRLRDAAASSPSVQHIAIPRASHNDVIAQGARPIANALTELLAPLRQSKTRASQADSTGR